MRTLIDAFNGAITGPRNRAARALVPLTLSLSAAPRVARSQATPQGAPPTARANTPRLLVRAAGVFDGDSGDPVEGVELRDMLTGRVVTTSHVGVAALVFADTTRTIIALRKVGYAPHVQIVTTSPRDTTPLTLVIYRTSQRLPTVVVTDSSIHFISAYLRGFEERRRAGLGYFVTDAQLRKNENWTMADIVRANVPGVTIQEGRTKFSSDAQFVVTARGPASCYPDVYIDGVLAVKDGPGVDLHNFSATDFAGVEFHTGATAPPEYSGTGSGCGVLLLWTRER